MRRTLIATIFPSALLPLVLAASSVTDVQATGDGCFDNPVIAENFPDPTFWKGDDGWYYGTATGLQTIRRSRDLVTWEDTGVHPLQEADLSELRKFSGNFWAPDVIRVGKTYNLYFTQFVSSDTNRLVCATSDRAEGPFKVRSIVLESWKRGKRDCAIDAEVVESDGRLWMFVGSVAGGVWRTWLTADGLGIDPSASFEHVAGLIPKFDERSWIYSHACYEGSYVFRRGRWWYLVVSSGAINDGSYRLFVGRSDRIDGVFRDRQGYAMTESGGERLLRTNPDSEFSGSGHNGDVFEDADGRTYMFIHSQWKGLPPKKGSWRSGPRCTSLQEMKWREDGWPYFETGALVKRERRPNLPSSAERLTVDYNNGEWRLEK